MVTGRKTLLLAIATATSSAVFASGAWSMSEPLPGVGYVWAQPSASLVGVTCAEPGSTTTSAASMKPVAGCVWAQPDAILIGVASTEP
jgi:hypothetical protein